MRCGKLSSVDSKREFSGNSRISHENYGPARDKRCDNQSCCDQPDPWPARHNGGTFPENLPEGVQLQWEH